MGKALHLKVKEIKTCQSTIPLDGFFQSRTRIGIVQPYIRRRLLHLRQRHCRYLNLLLSPNKVHLRYRTFGMLKQKFRRILSIFRSKFNPVSFFSVDWFFFSFYCRSLITKGPGQDGIQLKLNKGKKLSLSWKMVRSQICKFRQFFSRSIRWMWGCQLAEKHKFLLTPVAVRHGGCCVIMVNTVTLCPNGCGFVPSSL